jgi:hypothetical protein
MTELSPITQSDHSLKAELDRSLCRKLRLQYHDVMYAAYRGRLYATQAACANIVNRRRRAVGREAEVLAIRVRRTGRRQPLHPGQ